MSDKSSVGNGLGEMMAGCAATKTKPIRRVEIATSAYGLLAMTCARRARLSGGGVVKWRTLGTAAGCCGRGGSLRAAGNRKG
jgi:hypothetical protein